MFQASHEDEDAKATIKGQLLGDIFKLSETIRSDGQSLKDLLAEANSNGTDFEDVCRNLTDAITGAGRFVGSASEEVATMVTNSSDKVDQLLGCFHGEDTPFDAWGSDDPGNCTDPGDPVCELNDLIACMGRPISDGLDCLDRNLAEAEEMRKNYLTRMASLAAEMEVQTVGVYQQLKDCVLNFPTPQPGSAANLLFHPIILWSTALLTLWRTML
ncbi:hypothetical protein AAG570_005747 [Ranatra chinensis]|uniref:Uncharacterized protein n=1 Tax=Ranatra chinensis TaxID=642074 RepID=A0ABD0XYB8_9HEMI